MPVTVHIGRVIPDDEPAPDLTITEAPDPGDLRTLETHLDASRPAHLPTSRRPLAAFVKDGDTLLGGVAGYTQYGWFSVDQVWGHREAARHRPRRTTPTSTASTSWPSGWTWTSTAGTRDAWSDDEHPCDQQGLTAVAQGTSWSPSFSLKERGWCRSSL